MNKKLIINADDYGICPEVNQAIENLITWGKLKNVSVIANSWYYDEAIEFLRNKPTCSLGIHLNVLEGVSISTNSTVEVLLDHHGQFIKLKQLFYRWLKSPLAVVKAVELEWRKQIEKLLKDGLEISHADSHQHIHAFPPFWKIIVNLCREYQLNCLRIPIEINQIRRRRIPSFALNQSQRIARIFSPGKDLCINNHFLGFKRAGSYGESEMLTDLENLEGGVTEMVVHPSLCNYLPYPELAGELEYQGLLSPKVWRKIDDLGIKIVTWDEIGQQSITVEKNELALEKN